MMKYFLPHQADFFALFNQTAVEMVAVSEQFAKLVNHLDEGPDTLKKITEHELKAHQLTETTLEKLHKTFITPFDRYDIHRFVKKMDDVVDAFDRTSKRIVSYKVKVLPNEIRSLAELCVKAVGVIKDAVFRLNSLKNAIGILKLCDEVNTYETEAENLLLVGVSNLFDLSLDAAELVKTKEIFGYTKSILTGCQTISNIIKDIVLEYS